MAFIAGPRQVGKTTLCRQAGDVYLDWDNDNHRDIILKGPDAVADFSRVQVAGQKPIVIVFDELHKNRRWKQFLKGFFDTYEERARVLVTGSSRLDLYRRGGDSLMGRYFLFHMHPFSVAEIAHPTLPDRDLVRTPSCISDDDWSALLEFGGFPEPFIKRSTRFSTRWQNLRRNQLLREDVRDLTRIQELDQLASLTQLLGARSGEQITYASLANTIRTSENTIRSWIATLCALHHGFLVRPWHKNITKALRKEPKWFLRDWSGIEDAGQRAETFCACHLLKAVEGWTDLGLGTFELRYIRDQQKREVDFIVIRDNAPWFIVEVKHRDTSCSPTLRHFQTQTGCPHAFQVVIDLDYIDANVFSCMKPTVVPARTFLSQLL
ncbi:MAG: ATP-binding protein [Spartobacteria bacterium]|nr:ATP-binding protein [Spartobacteria bacterium]